MRVCLTAATLFELYRVVEKEKKRKPTNTAQSVAPNSCLSDLVKCMGNM